MPPVGNEPHPLERIPGQGGWLCRPGHLLVSLGQRQEADAGMVAPAVVEDLEVLEERPSRCRLGREGRAVHELVLGEF
jgi:hypothetical protein